MIRYATQFSTVVEIVCPITNEIAHDATLTDRQPQIEHGDCTECGQEYIEDIFAYVNCPLCGNIHETAIYTYTCRCYDE